MSFARRNRSGMTLFEVLIALVILAILAGQSAYTMRLTPNVSLTFEESVAALRREAVTRGHPRTATIAMDSTVAMVTALPDGRIVRLDIGRGSE